MKTRQNGTIRYENNVFVFLVVCKSKLVFPHFVVKIQFRVIEDDIIFTTKSGCRGLIDPNVFTRVLREASRPSTSSTLPCLLRLTLPVCESIM